MKRYIAALLLACCVEGYAQEKKQALCHLSTFPLH